VAETLRRALALGARRAIHVRGEVPADPRLSAISLAAAVRRVGCDLMLTGAQSSDLGWGLTGTLVAAELGWPHVWLAVGATLEPGDGAGMSLRVTRELERRRREVSRLILPAVLCVQTGLHPARMPRIRDLLEAKRRPIESWEQETATSSGQCLAPCIELVRLMPPRGAGGTRIAGTPAAAARELVGRLRRDGLLPEGR
jgi:electron transfer flavoprotein beta subunit